MGPNRAKADFMATRFIQLLLMISVCVFFSGCWVVVIGGAGAVGGYAATQDTFEGVSAKGQEELMDAAHKVLSVMGTINKENAKDGIIDATVYGNHVTVTVVQINLTTSKLRVKARKDLLPSRAIAQEVYTKIINQLEQ